MNVVVAGAGLAGLAVTLELTDLGHRVTLLERRPFAGGKTYSFRERETGEEIDNGQHVFMRCTTEYVRFLRRLGTLGMVRLQDRLRVDVFGPDGRRSVLAADGLKAPLHLARSFARFSPLAVRDRPGAGRLMLSIQRMSEDERLALRGWTFHDWLRSRGQPASAVRDFWDFILLPTLNCRSTEASAADALFVLREGLLKSSSSAAIGVAQVGLSALHVKPVLRRVEAAGGCVKTGATVKAVVMEDGLATGVRLGDGSAVVADAVICALPPREAAAILPAPVLEDRRFIELATMRMAPIVNLHVWFDRPVATFPFAAFARSELQWVFNRSVLRGATGSRDHLAVSLSGASPYMSMTKAELENRFVPLLRAALPLAAGARVERFVVIKEPEATFVPAPGLVRPPNETGISNLCVAGAYTATGWPATMESAVRSGLAAARALHRTLADGQSSSG